MAVVRSRSGVSIIELLVLSATLALAAAVLAPALVRNQANSRLTAEMGVLRVIMQAATKYSHDDPDGIIAPVHELAGNFTGDGYAEYGGGPGPMPYSGWNQEFDPRTRPLNRILYGYRAIIANTAPGDPNAFREYLCRGEDRGYQDYAGFGPDPRETEPNSYFKGNGTSFRMNNLAYEGGFSVGVYGRPVTRIPAPSETIIYMESRAYETLWTNDAWPSLEPGELNGYHDKLGYFMVNYVDGHAAFSDFGDGTYYQHLGGPSPYDQDLDARGTWGRMDCLPEKNITF